MRSIEHGQGAPGQGKSAADTFRDRDARGSGRRGFDAPRARPLRKRRTEGPGISRSLPKSAHAPGELLREFFHARVLEDIEDRSDCHLYGAARHVGIRHLGGDWSLDDVELGEIAMFEKRPVVGFRDPFTSIGEIDPCLSQICERVENSHNSLRFLKSSPHWEQPKTHRAGRTVSGTASSSRRRLGGRGGTDFLRGGWRAATLPPAENWGDRDP